MTMNKPPVAIAARRTGLIAAWLAPAVLLAGTLPALAGTIDFNSPGITGANVTNGYGNTSSVSVSYQYVADTCAPNLALSVSCLGAVESGYGTQIGLWHPGLFTNYGDLGVVATPPDGVFTPGAVAGFGEITLTPVSGDSVTLDSFDAGTFSDTTVYSQLLAVLGSSGNVLTQYADQTVNTPGGEHLTFSPDVTSNGPLTLVFGTSGNVGVNYIDFTSQPGSGSGGSSAPEPGPLPLLAAGLILLGVLRRHRRGASLG